EIAEAAPTQVLLVLLQREKRFLHRAGACLAEEASGVVAIELFGLERRVPASLGDEAYVMLQPPGLASLRRDTHHAGVSAAGKDAIAIVERGIELHRQFALVIVEARYQKHLARSHTAEEPHRDARVPVPHAGRFHTREGDVARDQVVHGA